MIKNERDGREREHPSEVIATTWSLSAANVHGLIMGLLPSVVHNVTTALGQPSRMRSSESEEMNQS